VVAEYILIFRSLFLLINEMHYLAKEWRRRAKASVPELKWELKNNLKT
jgi:hypothetical protein